MTILLALLSAPADAASFSVGMIPYTTDFDFTWTTAGGTPIVSGNTSFTFDTATRVRPNLQCRRVAGCMDGTFYTGNGGTGAFATRLDVEGIDDCTVTAGPFAGPLGSTYYDVSCTITQTLSLTYDTTGAVYDGSSECGEMTATAWYAGSTFLFFTGRTWGTVPGTISGDLSSPSGAIGTFTE